jgi:hypothetical protein
LDSETPNPSGEQVCIHEQTLPGIL